MLTYREPFFKRALGHVRVAHFCLLLAIPLSIGAMSACSADEGTSKVSSGGQSTGGSGNKSGAGGIIGIGGSGNSSGTSSGGGGTGNTGPWSLPAGFTQTEFGGYKLGDPFSGNTPPSSADAGTGTSSGTCSTILAVVRDFKGVNETGGHPDFQAFHGDTPTLGLVPPDLGPDQKPGYTGICEAANAGNTTTCPFGQQTTSLSYFNMWYNYTVDVNKPYILYLSFQPNGNVVTFESDLFFPLDNAGWGNSGTGTDGKQHNFGFTTEVHTEFRYNGGEQFTFIGDDDVWVFVNNKLAVDLGGLHPKQTGSVNLDAKATDLGITTGNTYPLDLFHAERHTQASDFRIDTNFYFTNCGIVVPDVPR